MSTEKKPQATLMRQLNPINVWAIAFGCIIGWGSFINPGKKFLPNSGVAGTAIAMLLGVKKAGFIQTVLATLLAVCAFTLCILLHLLCGDVANRLPLCSAPGAKVPLIL